MLYKHHPGVKCGIRATITKLGGEVCKVLFQGQVGLPVTLPQNLLLGGHKICSYSPLMFRRSEFGFTRPEFCVRLSNLGHLYFLSLPFLTRKWGYHTNNSHTCLMELLSNSGRGSTRKRFIN